MAVGFRRCSHYNSHGESLIEEKGRPYEDSAKCKWQDYHCHRCGRIWVIRLSGVPWRERIAA